MSEEMDEDVQRIVETRLLREMLGWKPNSYDPNIILGWKLGVEDFAKSRGLDVGNDEKCDG